MLYASSDGWSTNPSAGLGYCPYKKVSNSTVATLMETKTINKPYTTINGYTPKNNKLFTAPFKYLLVDNNSGGAARAGRQAQQKRGHKRNFGSASVTGTY